jgi:hypothetical protein
LKERFARGEIDKAEFEERRQVISEPRQEAASTARNRKGYLLIQVASEQLTRSSPPELLTPARAALKDQS